MVLAVVMCRRPSRASLSWRARKRQRRGCNASPRHCSSTARRTENASYPARLGSRAIMARSAAAATAPSPPRPTATTTTTSITMSAVPAHNLSVVFICFPKTFFGGFRRFSCFPSFFFFYCSPSLPSLPFYHLHKHAHIIIVM